MLPREPLLQALTSLPLVTETGPWTRAVAQRYLAGPPPGATNNLPRPLWSGGAKLFGQRFTPKGSFDTAYLASDPVTALTEVQAILSGPNGKIPLTTNPWVLVSLTGVVHQVLDLTSETVVSALGTSFAELSGAWAFVPGSRQAPTQLLGEAAFTSKRIHGIKYHSAKNMGQGTCLAVFPDRLDPALERVEVFDSSGNLVDRLPEGRV